MSITDDHGNRLTAMRKPSPTEAEIIRLRDREFYIRLVQGWNYKAIARMYGVSGPFVHKRIKDCLPEAEKVKIRRMDLA